MGPRGLKTDRRTTPREAISDVATSAGRAPRAININVRNRPGQTGKLYHSQRHRKQRDGGRDRSSGPTNRGGPRRGGQIARGDVGGRNRGGNDAATSRHDKATRQTAAPPGVKQDDTGRSEARIKSGIKNRDHEKTRRDKPRERRPKRKDRTDDARAKPEPTNAERRSSPQIVMSVQDPEWCWVASNALRSETGQRAQDLGRCAASRRSA